MRILKFVFALLLILAVASCGKKKNVDVEAFRSSLTAHDSVEVLTMCDRAMENLKNKNVDAVLAEMYEYDDSTCVVSKISDETAARYRHNFEMFPVLEYEREYFSFLLEGCNDVKYSVVFATAEQTGLGEPAKISYMFNPVKVDGSWKLCVKTAKDMMDADFRKH